MSLSQKQFNDFKQVCEQLNQTEEIIEEELVLDICDEIVEELIEEGYSEEDAIIIVEEATNDYIDEAKVTFGHDTQAKRASGAPVGAKRRFAMRKAGDAVKAAGSAAKGAMAKAKSKAAGAAVDASIAASSAKKTVSGAASSAKKAADSAAGAVKSAPGKAKAAASDAKKKAKSGIKGFIKRQAQKVVSRMSEEIESLKATGKFSEQEIAAIEEAMSSYDRNRKRAAQRAAARNAARDAGKTGAVPGVGYVTPRRERETYVDSAGTTRHKSGAKMPKN